MAEPEEDVGGPGDWIVTFSDCMTLLLCFFVLLLTFSSFDKGALKRLSGAFPYTTEGAISKRKQQASDAMKETPQEVLSLTAKGSEKPTDTPVKAVKNPRKAKKTPGQDAHKERKVFYIPSEQMFVGRGPTMKDAGKGHLDRIVSFIEMKPCLVTVNESRLPTAAVAGRAARRADLERARRIVQHCVQRGVSVEYFSITADGGIVSQRRFAGQPIIEIALVAPRANR